MIPHCRPVSCFQPACRELRHRASASPRWPSQPWARSPTANIKLIRWLGAPSADGCLLRRWAQLQRACANRNAPPFGTGAPQWPCLSQGRTMAHCPERRADVQFSQSPLRGVGKLCSFIHFTLCRATRAFLTDLARSMALPLPQVQEHDARGFVRYIEVDDKPRRTA